MRTIGKKVDYFSRIIHTVSRGSPEVYAINEFLDADPSLSVITQPPALPR